ncbi:MAG: choice-of-anchor L domain-containing protein [Myxococcales bacterium]|nr:choice-of-anchor L domain-containing protein [Myxococcales bacterium]MCB9754716.1 choice-of-anchor L domain-containing protein [Myxococcales bacterium]
MQQRTIGLCALLGLGMTLAACGDNENTSDSSVDTDDSSATTGASIQPTGAGPAGETESATDNSGSDSGTMSSTDTDATETGVDPSAGGVCGDGNLDPGEQCDDGNDIDDDMCANDCTANEKGECGDGVLDDGEQCDDGNLDPGDGCDDQCNEELDPFCGDGNVDADLGEECDDGNMMDGDGCDGACVTEPCECGNGVQEWCEACDDGNDVDNDNCTSDCTPPPDEECQPEPVDPMDPDPYISCDGMLDKNEALSPFQAMDLNCGDAINETIFISNPSLNSNNANAWQIAKGFGTYEAMPGELLYSPRKGESFLMVSSGVISAPNGNGIVTEAPSSQGGNGDNQNDDSDNPPPPINIQDGSNNGQGGTPFMNCDGVGDCSDSLESQWLNIGNGNPNDKLWFSFNATPPALTLSYSFSFVYCSSEYPSWVNTSFNDLIIVWQVNEQYTGNVTFIDGNPLTVTALAPYLGNMGYSGNEPQLAGTGFEGNACSDWFTVQQNVQSGTDLSMTFFIADMGDSVLATLGIFDNFRWQCKECIQADDPVCQAEVPDPDCCGVIIG